MNDLIPKKEELENYNLICGYAIRSKLIPDEIKTPDQAIIIALKGRELGIPPMQAFSQIRVIKGKPCISAELMLALIYKNVPTAEVNFLETNEKICKIKARRNPSHEYCTFIFSIEDAKRAELLNKESWIKYPAAMLRARCISAMARALFPDAIAGASYTPEELEDVTTPQPQPPMQPKNETIIETTASVVNNTDIKNENTEPKIKASPEKIRALKTIMIQDLKMTIEEAIKFIHEHTGKKSTHELTEQEVETLFLELKTKVN